MLFLNNICKTYTKEQVEQPVLHNINLEVREHDFLMLYGKSGSGKTTLLNIIGLIDSYSSGKYLINGTDTSGFTDNQLAAMRNQTFGYVFQSFYLIPELNILDNICLPARYFKKNTSSEILNRAKLLIDDVGLSNRKFHMPSQLSGGEKQRVAIARALINNPSIILADEPTGNLDSRNSHNIMEILKRKHSEGKTIIMISHDPMLKKYATRTVHMIDGSIIE